MAVDEEAWYAAFQVAVLLERLDAPGPEVVAAYRAAYAARICRAEPLCELARYLRMRCEFVDDTGRPHRPRRRQLRR
ncbi:hypothetical protein PEC18_37725 [Paucibacter sp. O1-1]|nr:hypothetical protein [Paucibacter sp. O1-1]MDA3831374.1 hypothetical protein [Paucibacter sp. O1-1]